MKNIKRCVKIKILLKKNDTQTRVIFYILSTFLSAKNIATLYCNTALSSISGLWQTLGISNILSIVVHFIHSYPLLNIIKKLKQYERPQVKSILIFMYFVVLYLIVQSVYMLLLNLQLYRLIIVLNKCSKCYQRTIYFFSIEQNLSYLYKKRRHLLLLIQI